MRNVVLVSVWWTVGFTWRIRMQAMSKGFGEPPTMIATTWRVWHHVSLTSFTAHKGTTRGISCSLTDGETDSERLIGLPEITQQAVGWVRIFKPSFVCHRSLSFPHCIHRITRLASCLLRWLGNHCFFCRSGLFFPVWLGHEGSQQPLVERYLVGMPGQGCAEPSVKSGCLLSELALLPHSLRCCSGQ